MEFLDVLKSFIGTAVTVVVIIASFLLVKKLMSGDKKAKSKNSLYNQLILFLMAVIGLVMIVSSLPIDAGLKGQILSLIGIILSATIALSSTTMMGNILAGVMNKVVGSFDIGDFIKVEKHFGRVTSTGLFHTEIQNINRDLLTLPNLYLATNTVEVIRSSGTIIFTTVSLGYDVSREKIEKVLIEAANDIGLTGAFVFVTELGDYSIVYKIHGLLKDTKKVLSVKSTLNKSVLDHLHKAKIEIVSPVFMNQRQVDEQVFIPKRVAIKKVMASEATEDDPENIIFDKATQAETIENVRDRIEEVDAYVEELKVEMKEYEDKDKIERRIDRLLAFKQTLQGQVDEATGALEKD